VFLETSLAEPEGVELRLPGGQLLDSLCRFAARQGLAVVWAGGKDHPPEPLRLGPITAFFGQDGEVAYGEVAVNALVDAAELIGSFSPLATPHELPHSLNASSLAVRAPPRAARWVLELLGATGGPFPSALTIQGRRVERTGIPLLARLPWPGRM
jgi:hypothetical protein